jgi:hypothetical protein
MKPKWTRFTHAEFVERMYSLDGMTMLLWKRVRRSRMRSRR